MKSALKSYLIILLNIIIGLVLLIVFQKVSLPNWIDSSIILLFAFLLLNLLNARLFNLWEELSIYWSPKKLAFLGTGLLIGTGISLLPGILAWLFAYPVNFNPQFDFASFLITLAIVSWEELWFRGLFLNYAGRQHSILHLSLLMGLLFMLIHVFNPEMDLLISGPNLFFAGACLTLLYFYFRNIWLPLGMHWGNNYFGGFIEAEAEGHAIFGSEGYLNALVLAAIFCIFMLRIKLAKKES